MQICLNLFVKDVIQIEVYIKIYFKYEGISIKFSIYGSCLGSVNTFVDILKSRPTMFNSIMMLMIIYRSLLDSKISIHRFLTNKLCMGFNTLIELDKILYPI